MITPARAGFEKKVLQSPQPKIVSARSDRVPQIAKAKFLKAEFKEEGTMERLEERDRMVRAGLALSCEGSGEQAGTRASFNRRIADCGKRSEAADLIFELQISKRKSMKAIRCANARRSCLILTSSF